MKTRILSLLLLSIAVTPAQQLERVWTDETGRITKASLVKVENGNAMLLMPDGRKIPFPIGKLSKTDQAFIADFEKKREQAKEGEVTSPEDNFDAPWPERIDYDGDPEITTVKEDADSKSFIYESANYRYICDVRLSKSVVKGFAVMFEATYQFVRELPLGVNGGVKQEGKYLIKLMETEASYHAAGGPPGSAGVFMGGKNIVMVPLTSLGVRPVGSGYMLDRDKSNKTLPHELVHQLTPAAYYAYGSMGWFTEGLAEYVAVTPYSYGNFNVKTNFKPIVEYVTSYGKKGKGGRAIGTDIKLGSLRDWMLMPYSSFTGNAQINYGCALLITNYFFHMDRDEDAARIKKFLRALKAGKEGDEALAVLLDGQTWEELESDIAKAYSRKGVDFTFSK
jgi:hypothetical protein